jgi:hypothetical protein
MARRARHSLVRPQNFSYSQTKDLDNNNIIQVFKSDQPKVRLFATVKLVQACTPSTLSAAAAHAQVHYRSVVASRARNYAEESAMIYLL